MTEEYNTLEKISKLKNIDDVLEKIVTLYNSKIKGEEHNIKFLYCVCLSKDLPRDYRIHAIIQSESSAGKSNLLNTILEAFTDSVLDFTEFTNAFINRSENNYDGYIFKLEQMEKTNEDKHLTIGNLKPLLSEGKLRIGLIEKDNKGKNKPKTLEVDGIPVFISTSTKYNMDQETLNRMFLMQVDESKEQTKRIIDHVLDKYSNINYDSNWQKNKLELIEITKTYSEIANQIEGIFIPFKEKIRDIIPTEILTIRRDLSKILNLTCVIAFLNFTKRRLIPCSAEIRLASKTPYFYDKLNAEPLNRYYLIAEPDDFREALKIGGEAIEQTLNKMNQSSKAVYDIFVELYKEEPDGITNKDIADKSTLSQNRIGEIMKQLYEMGYVTRKKEGKQHHYFATSKKFENIQSKEIVFTESELESWLEAQGLKQPQELGTN